MAQPAHRQENKPLELLMEQTWVNIQQRTFTRWCNTFLVQRNMKIEDFLVDFTDGVAFCNLLEIISNKKLIKWNVKPRIKAQKLENCAIGLQFLQSEGIKLVGIGNEDIVEPKRKLILGLIWTIILRYQIQRGEDDSGSARSELLKWVRSKIPEYDIKNFAGDWTSGKAICALAEACEPGQMKLPGDFKNDPLADATMGMENAEKNMEIPMVLHPSDMIGEPDELSNMTYISYFRDYCDKRGERDLEERIRRTPVAEQCRAYGPGLEHGEALIPGLFVIEARNNRGELIPMGGFPFTATCKDASGKFVGVTVKDNLDGTLSAAYTPLHEGPHTIEVNLNGVPVGGANGHAKSPFVVEIQPAQVDASKCQMYGPGLERGNVGEVATFTVKAFNRFGTPIESNAIPFKLHVEGPVAGADPQRQRIVGGKVPGEFQAEYLPLLHGQHTVTVELNGHQVAQSPVVLNIDRNPNASDPAQSWAEHLNDPTTMEPVKMRIHAVRPDGKPMGHGGEKYDAEVVDPNGNVVPCKVTDNGDGTYDVEMDCQEAGPHNVDLFLRNKDLPTHIEHIKDFPATINVEPGVDARQTIVSGPGLEDGILDTHPQYFTVEYRDKHGRPLGAKGTGMPPTVEIQGPRGVIAAHTTDNGDGTYRVDYEPLAAGDHKISVTLDGTHLADSAYTVRVDAGAFPGTTCIRSYSFVVESRTRDNQLKNVGGELDNFEVTIEGNGNPQAEVQDGTDGTYLVSYALPGRGQYNINVKLNGAHIQGSPFKQTL